jgi:hypothetical protein
MIHELLAEGRENARTGRELAKYLNCRIRDITIQVERERRQGQPICAATGDNPGYYLAATPEELEHYCDRLKGRAIEMFKTRQALVRVLRQVRDARQQEA